MLHSECYSVLMPYFHQQSLQLWKKTKGIVLQISLRIVPKTLIFTGLYLHKSFRNLTHEKHPLKNLPYAAWRGKHQKQLVPFIRQRYRITLVLNVSAEIFPCLCLYSSKAGQNWHEYHTRVISYSWFPNYLYHLLPSRLTRHSYLFGTLLIAFTSFHTLFLPLPSSATPILPKLSRESKKRESCYFQKPFVKGEHCEKSMSSYWGCLVPDFGSRYSTKL